MGEGVEYHTLYGVRRPLHRRYTTDMRLNLLTGYTVLGSISVYARRALSDEWLAAVRLRLSRRSDSSSLDCTYKGSSPGQSVEPDTGQEWQPTTHRSHGDSAAIDDGSGGLRSSIRSRGAAAKSGWSNNLRIAEAWKTNQPMASACDTERSRCMVGRSGRTHAHVCSDRPQLHFGRTTYDEASYDCLAESFERRA